MVTKQIKVFCLTLGYMKKEGFYYAQLCTGENEVIKHRLISGQCERAEQLLCLENGSRVFMGSTRRCTNSTRWIKRSHRIPEGKTWNFSCELLRIRWWNESEWAGIRKMGPMLRTFEWFASLTALGRLFPEDRWPGPDFNLCSSSFSSDHVLASNLIVLRTNGKFSYNTSGPFSDSGYFLPYCPSSHSWLTI